MKEDKGEKNGGRGGKENEKIRVWNGVFFLSPIPESALIMIMIMPCFSP